MSRPQGHLCSVHRVRAKSVWLLTSIFTFLLATWGFGQSSRRDYDARASLNQSLAAQAASGDQLVALDDLRLTVPDAIASFDETTGITRSLYNPSGTLTGPSVGSDPVARALAFVEGSPQLLGVGAASANAGSELRLREHVRSRTGGGSHVYFEQRYAGLSVYNGQVQVNLTRDGNILSVNNSCMPELLTALNSRRPRLSASQAVTRAAEHLGVSLRAEASLVEAAKGAEQATSLEQRELSREIIRARLSILPIRRGNARLVWNFQIHTLDEQHVYDFTVDAVSGEVWTRIDWVSADNYRVYERPVESPNHSASPPPNDGRTVAVDPAIAAASPQGWHSTGANNFTILRGNNVHAYEDRDGNNAPPSQQPNCGAGLNCDFPLDLSQDPVQSESAAIANLFYWNNVIHDVQYLYGFDESAGNFQVNNFGNGGAGNDDVRAEAQDGGGTNNANFFAPPDGQRPRMQMYFWTTGGGLRRDGDFDNGIVVHEYGHGISIRQVGGPANSGCLGNAQQPGEGWSDWFALAYTAEAGDSGPDPRGIGTYALRQSVNGAGIRTQRYSTDPSINNHTYESIRGMAVPHGVGEVWAQALWEVYWALVDKYGFDPDLANISAAAGNHRAMLYVNEGLKNTACSPTFTDARDGIIQAAIDNFGGVDVCTLWQAFADFGLGVDAVSGGPNSTNPTNGFAIPASCSCTPTPIADAGPDRNSCGGEAVTIGTPALPGHSYQWSPGGQSSAQISVAPLVTTSYTVTAATACGTAQDSVTVFVDGPGGGGLQDDFESGASGWTTSGLWHLAANSQCASPQPGYASPVGAFYFGDEGLCSYNTGVAVGELTSPAVSGILASSTLSFNYLREVESFSQPFDVATVLVVAENGSETPVFRLDSTDPSSAQWTSSPQIPLGNFAGQTIRVKFRFDSGDGQFNDFIGWFIDDVVVTGSPGCAPTNQEPTVTITAPPDGTTVTAGQPLAFAGTASDPEDGPITASISWSSSLDGNLGSGGSVTSVLTLGQHLVTASVVDSGGLSATDSIQVTVVAAPPPPSGNIDWNQTQLVSYSNQDAGGVTTVEDNGATLSMTGNTWRRTVDSFTITPFTVLQFEFQSTVQGEIHGIGFDENDNLTDAPRIFNLYGTQNWNADIDDYDGDYSPPGSFVTYRIPVGAYYRGEGFHLVLTNDKDSGTPNNTSRFRNVRIVEKGGSSNPIDLGTFTFSSYSNQDNAGSGPVTIEDGGATIAMLGNRWRRTNQTFAITPGTVIAFDFSSTSQGEIHGLGFDEDDSLTNAARLFRIFGTQNWNADIDWPFTYLASEIGTTKTFVIPVGRFYSGNGFRLVFMNDKDSGTPNNTSRFTNVRIYELN